jgi:hypothetical protein
VWKYRSVVYTKSINVFLPRLESKAFTENIFSVSVEFLFLVQFLNFELQFNSLIRRDCDTIHPLLRKMR